MAFKSVSVPNEWRIWIPGSSLSLGPGMTSPQIQFLEKVVALVVDDDEGRKIHHLDAPDRFHAEFGIFQILDLLDAMLGEGRRRAADRGEIEAVVLLAGVAHNRSTITLRQ